jgi:hypothetical protein
MSKNNQKPIFIIGCERSGTTLIRLILHSHPNIALPPQTKFLKKIYKRRLQWRNLANEANRIKLSHWFTDHFDNHTKLPDLGLEAGDIRKEIVSSATSLGAAATGVFKLYSRKFNKPRWGDKRPYYIKYVKQLLALFPDAQIIHVVRDGRDCIASLMKMPWWKKDLAYTILNWQEAIQEGKRANRSLPVEQFIEIRYEDFVSHPEKWARELCRFLGEKYNSDMLKFQEIAEMIKMIDDGKITHNIASKIIFNELIKNPDKSPQQIADEQNLTVNNDSSELKQIIEDVLAKYPAKVEEYKKGKKGLIGLFMGEVMKATKGKANPKEANKLLNELLNK